MALAASLLNLAISLYPDQPIYIDKVLRFAHSALEKSQVKEIDVLNPTCGKVVVKLLRVPIDLYKNVMKILPFEFYPKDHGLLSLKTRRFIARLFAIDMIENCAEIKFKADLEAIIQIIGSLNTDKEPTIGSPGSANSSRNVSPIPKILSRSRIFCQDPASYCVP